MPTFRKCCSNYIHGQIIGVYPGTGGDEPAEPEWCYQWAEFDYVYTTEINGVNITMLTDDAIYQAIVGLYNDYQGVVGVRAGMQKNPSNQTWYIQVFRPYGTPPFATLGTYVDGFDPENPVTYDIIPNNEECVAPTTYEAVFTPNDPSLTSFVEEFIVDGLVWDGTPGGLCYPAFDIITENDFFTVLNNTQGNVFEPGATFNISINGNEVTVQLTTIIQPTSWEWGNSTQVPACLSAGGNSGFFNFTAI